MSEKNVKQTIIDLEKAALEEWNRGNPTPFLNLYSEDITYFDPVQERRIDGWSKMKDLYESLKGGIKVDRYEMINPVVQHTGNVAVLSYNLLSYAGENLWKWNCTEVYTLDDNHNWKIIHSHWSFIKPNIQ